MSPNITVVIPVYNMEKYLKKCMDILLEQTYTSYELLLVDDGSSDSSPEICDKYADEYPEKVRCIHKKNGGISCARNTGIENAKGKYIIFHDPDDWAEKNYLESLAQMQKLHKNALVCCGYSKEYSDRSVKENDTDKAFIWQRREGFLHLLKKPDIGGFTWNKLFRLDIIKENKLLFKDDAGTKEDLDFTARYIQFTDEVYFNPSEVLYHYYQREGAATWRGFSQRKMQGIKAYENMLGFYPDDAEITAVIKTAICSSAVNLMVMYRADSADDKKSWDILKSYVRKNIKEVLKNKNCSRLRKLQSIICCISPDILYRIKKRMSDIG